MESSEFEVSKSSSLLPSTPVIIGGPTEVGYWIISWTDLSWGLHLQLLVRLDDWRWGQKGRRFGNFKFWTLHGFRTFDSWQLNIQSGLPGINESKTYLKVLSMFILGDQSRGNIEEVCSYLMSDRRYTRFIYFLFSLIMVEEDKLTVHVQHLFWVFIFAIFFDVHNVRSANYQTQSTTLSAPRQRFLLD